MKSTYLILLAAAVVAAPAFAQFDLAGEWGQRQHEDGAERGQGPPIGDDLGLPINGWCPNLASSASHPLFHK